MYGLWQKLRVLLQQCNAAFYCNPSCQKRDWAAHHFVCGKSASLQLKPSVLGKGLFAARPISANSVVLLEEPIVQLMRYTRGKEEQGLNDEQLRQVKAEIEQGKGQDMDLSLLLGVKLLLSGQAGAFCASHSARSPWKFEEWMPILHEVLKMPANEIQEAVCCVEAYMFNFISPHVGHRGAGLFRTASWINHRCRAPNCEWVASPFGIIIVSVRSIAADEEITLSYTSLSPLGANGALGFQCKCKDCLGPAPPTRETALQEFDISDAKVGAFLVSKFRDLPTEQWVCLCAQEIERRVFHVPTPMKRTEWPDFSALLQIRGDIWTAIRRVPSVGELLKDYLVSLITTAMIMSLEEAKSSADQELLGNYCSFSVRIADMSSSSGFDLVIAGANFHYHSSMFYFCGKFNVAIRSVQAMQLSYLREKNKKKRQSYACPKVVKK